MGKNEIDHWYALGRWPCGHHESSRFLYGPSGEQTRQVLCPTCGLHLRVLVEEHPRLPYGEVLFEPDNYRQPKIVWRETHLWRTFIGRRKLPGGKGSITRMASWLTVLYCVYCLGFAALLIWKNEWKYGLFGILGLLPLLLVSTMVRLLLKRRS